MSQSEGSGWMVIKVRGYSDVYKGSTIPYNAPHEV